jgi:F-box-like/Leucine Rich repeat
VEESTVLNKDGSTMLNRTTVIQSVTEGSSASNSGDTNGSAGSYCGRKSISDLPDEILIRIFSHFTHETLCTSVATVCRKWHCLSRDPILWKCVRVSTLQDCISQCGWPEMCACGYGLVVNKVKSFFASQPPLIRTKIVELSVLGCSYQHNNKIVEQVSNQCPAMEKFIFRVQGEMNSKAFRKLSFTHSSTLRSIELLGVKLTDGKYGVLANFTNLRELRLKQVPVGSKNLCEILEKCAKLEKVSLWGIKGLNDAALSVFASIHLRELEVTGAQLTNAACVALQDKCRNLEVLKITEAYSISSAGVSELFSVVKLREIEIVSARGVDNNGIFRPSFSTNIRRLRISNSPAFTDQHLLRVAEHCNQTLEELELSGTSVSNDGIKSIAMQCSVLRVLSLAYSIQLRDICLLDMLSLPPSLPQLQRLNVGNCGFRFGELMCQELQAVRPGRDFSIRGMVAPDVLDIYDELAQLRLRSLETNRVVGQIIDNVCILATGRILDMACSISSTLRSITSDVASLVQQVKVRSVRDVCSISKKVRSIKCDVVSLVQQVKEFISVPKASGENDDEYALVSSGENDDEDDRSRIIG